MAGTHLRSHTTNNEYVVVNDYDSDDVGQKHRLVRIAPVNHLDMAFGITADRVELDFYTCEDKGFTKEEEN